MKNPKLISAGKIKKNFFRITATIPKLITLAGFWSCNIVDSITKETIAQVYGDTQKICSNRAAKMISGLTALK